MGRFWSESYELALAGEPKAFVFFQPFKILKWKCFSTNANVYLIGGFGLNLPWCRWPTTDDRQTIILNTHSPAWPLCFYNNTIFKNLLCHKPYSIGLLAHQKIRWLRSSYLPLKRERSQTAQLKEPELRTQAIKIIIYLKITSGPQCVFSWWWFYNVDILYSSAMKGVLGLSCQETEIVTQSHCLNDAKEFIRVMCDNQTY